uniref:Methyltransferase type 11 domain-containing protein n=1 Tax=Panagrolaimus superbus TaxID=310955 RepID=A0A914Z343_9BILA
MFFIKHLFQKYLNLSIFRFSFHHSAILVLFICILFLSHNHWHLKQKLKKNCKIYDFQRKESYLAHLFLDNLNGIEIGGSLHNPFCLNTINVDFTNASTAYKKQEKEVSGGNYLEVDVVAMGDKLPFKNGTYDFVISSHVIEHFFDPIKTIEEWFRVIKNDGFIFMIIPHKDRTFDKPRNRSTLSELILRHENVNPNPKFVDDHHSVWITEDFLELCQNRSWKVVAMLDKDDKVGNGFTIVLQK